MRAKRDRQDERPPAERKGKGVGRNRRTEGRGSHLGARRLTKVKLRRLKGEARDVSWY